MRSLGPNALPPDGWPPCGHGHEVSELRRRRDGCFRAWCLICKAVGPTVPTDELIARGWRFDDVFDEGQS